VTDEMDLQILVQDSMTIRQLQRFAIKNKRMDPTIRVPIPRSTSSHKKQYPKAATLKRNEQSNPTQMTHILE
jgi:hypothetical protein